MSAPSNPDQLQKDRETLQRYLSGELRPSNEYSAFAFQKFRENAEMGQTALDQLNELRRKVAALEKLVQEKQTLSSNYYEDWKRWEFQQPTPSQSGKAEEPPAVEYAPEQASECASQG